MRDWVRATAKLTFEDIKDKLQKVFGEFGDEDEENTEVLPVKEESALYTNSSYKRGRGGQASQRGRGRGGRGAFQGAKKTNPMDQDGNVMRCHECESTRHFVADCPDRKRDRDQWREQKKDGDKKKDGDQKSVQSANMTVHLTLVAGVSDVQGGNNLGDTLGKGIIDSACTRSVAGELWVKEFMDTMEEKDKKEMEKSEKKSKSLFRFGDGRESKSKRELTVPTVCWRKSCQD